MTSSLIEIVLNTILIVLWQNNVILATSLTSFPVRSQTGSWKYINIDVDYEFIWFWEFRNNRVRKTTKMGLMYFFTSDFRIYGAISLKGMTSGTPLKGLKESSVSLLCCLEPIWLYLLTVKSYGQKLFQKIPFFRQFSTLNPSRFW